MELIDIVPVFNLYEEFWKIYTKSDNQPPQYIADTAQIERCIIGDGSEIYGRVRNCVIGPEVIVEEGAEVYDSILMQGAVIKKGTKIYKSIIAQDAVCLLYTSNGLCLMMTTCIKHFFHVMALVKRLQIVWRCLAIIV